MFASDFKPLNFFPKVSVAGCFCEFEGRFLILRRHPASTQGGTWGVPAGKMEQGESSIKAAIRETFEETGIILKEEELVQIGFLYIQLPGIDYIFHMFYKRFAELPAVQLNLKENLEGRWVTVEEALQMPLIMGGIDAVKKYQQWKSTLKHF